MEWRDEAIVLAARPFGESAKIVEVLTPRHGWAAGMVYGARGKRVRATLQPGNRVVATWRGRLDDQLGTLALELTAARAGPAMERAWGAFGLGAMASLLAFLPERDPHPRLYAASDALVEALAGAAPAVAGEVAVRFELIVLEEFGFGLDLSSCAGTGTRKDLVYVSPRSGRAVSRLAGAPYRERLLALPGFLVGGGAIDAPALDAGFRLTGHFLAAHVAALVHRPLPEPRERFVRAMVKAVARETTGAGRPPQADAGAR